MSHLNKAETLCDIHACSHIFVSLSPFFCVCTFIFTFYTVEIIQLL